MNHYIVDCRYVRTTAPVNQPDFTWEIEAASPEHAIQIAQETPADDDFIATGAHETLALIESLRYQNRILAQFGYEMACKSREASGDVAEFNALVSANGITVPGQDEDEEDERDIPAEAEALEAQYGDREHPDYPEHMWREDDATRLDYWEWVAERLAAIDVDWKSLDEHTRPPKN